MEPATLDSAGGANFVIGGTGLVADTSVWLGNEPLSAVTRGPDGHELVATLPPRDPPRAEGPVEVTAENEHGRATLRDGLVGLVERNRLV